MSDDNVQRRHTVYLLFGNEEECLYVGCSAKGFSRFRAHEETPWWPEVGYAHFEHYDDRRVALDRERTLIEQLAPLHNQTYRQPRTGRLNVVPPCEGEAA